MTARRPGFFGGLGRFVRSGVVAIALLATGCEPAPMPYAITSLAVLPPDVVPMHGLVGTWVGDDVSDALREHTLFRIVGADSTRRLIAGPEGLQYYQELVDEAKTDGAVDPQLASRLANRFNTNGLLLPTLEVAMSGLVDGRASLSFQVFEPRSGLRVWMDTDERPFRGTQGDAGFLRLVREMAADLVNRMPKPEGEAP
ncbi:MAG TPA: hypothetical protein V6D47_05340 [Oscillatoriaceae cyanobacterium]